MNHIRRILAAVATLAGALMALAAAPAAYASLPPHGGSGAGTGGAPTTVPVIAAGGMPGWQIALIAFGAALAGAAVAILLERAQMARKAHAATG
jgi:hypothetical protein